MRKRYCDLYERRKRTQLHLPATPLNPDEVEEWEAMEDGRVGDFDVQDILLYRSIVHQRLGELMAAAATATVRNRRSSRRTASTLLQPPSWLQESLWVMVEDDSAASDEFQRAVDLWEETKQNCKTALEENASWVALSVEIKVKEGVLAAYTPLASTIDQAAAKRIQMPFLSFVFQDFMAHGRLLGDFESIRFDTTLQDLYAEEERSDRSRHSVMTRHIGTTRLLEHSAAPPPFLNLRFLKNSKETTDFHIGINAEIQRLIVTMEPGCEWIMNGRSLIRPLPRLSKIKEFWEEVGFDFIDRVKSQGRELFAKAETAVTDHKSIDVDIWIDCPLIKILGKDESHALVVDLGQTRFRTERLAGVAKSKLIGTLKDEAVRLAALDKATKPAENTIEFVRSNATVNDSMRSAQFNDLMHGVQVYQDDMTALDDLSHTPSDMNGGIESFFYDSYALDAKIGYARLLRRGETVNIMESVDVRATVQRSIIPRDATLFRYKVLYSVGEISLHGSEDDALSLRDLLAIWKSVIKTSLTKSNESLDLSVHYGGVGIVLTENSDTPSHIRETINGTEED